MKFKLKFQFLFSLLILSCFVETSFALEIEPDGLPHLVWQKIATTNSLPCHPIGMAVSTVTGNVVAVASEGKGSDSTIYFLDHHNVSLGWQKKIILTGIDAISVQFGLGHYFVFGINRQTQQSIVETSLDDGATWIQSTIIGEVASYNHATFSAQIGVATGKEGIIAMTSDGVTWKQVSDSSQSKKNVVYGFLPTASDQGSSQNGFALLDDSKKRMHHFLCIKDYLTQKPFFSTDGINWINLKA